ncbi:LysM domain-containing protein [Brevibacterium sp. CBA3109]|uniref:LysM domain-containing protein n=1 Tax=Brevibacterium koreense TaxID=3140787 RepID=A0AAU7UNS4_9MICO
MYLLTACTVSWFCLIGAFIATWVHLPTPRSTTDLVVIIVVGTAAVLSARLGAVSLLTLLIRLLPNGRMRTIVTQSVLRIAPSILRSSVIAAASASLAVHAAQASPLPADTLVSEAPGTPTVTASATLDPGWPTAFPDDTAPNPGWPTVPPTAEPEPPAAEPDWPDAQPAPSPPQSQPPSDADSPADDTDADESVGKGSETHIVGAGESLWSIAVNQPSSGGTTQDIVDDIYSANREVIGANPNLIMPGQRLEIQP